MTDFRQIEEFLREQIEEGITRILKSLPLVLKIGDVKVCPEYTFVDSTEVIVEIPEVFECSTGPEQSHEGIILYGKAAKRWIMENHEMYDPDKYEHWFTDDELTNMSQAMRG